MRLNIIISIILLILFASLNLFAASESAAALYNRGNALYAQGLYGEAINAYLKASEAGARDSRLEYNLGNAYLKKNLPDPGRAILHYERARVLDPRDPDLLYNLEFAQSLIKEKSPIAERTYLQELWENSLARISANEVAAFFSLFLFLLCLFLSIRVVTRNDLTRRVAGWLFVISTALFILNWPIYFGKIRRLSEDRAVVIESNVIARSGPGESNTELFQLPVGTVVARKECRGEWCQASIKGGLAGWVPAKAIELIVPDSWRYKTGK